MRGGECSVRAGLGTLRDLKRKLERLRELRPDLLRGEVIPVIHTSLATPELVEEAAREGVWVLGATEDVVRPPVGRGEGRDPPGSSG